MKLALKFWGRLGIWGGGLFVFLVVISLMLGQSLGEALARAPVWLGLGMALAAYPAGIAVAQDVFPDGRFVLRRVVEVTLAAASVTLLMLTLGNVVGSWMSRTLGSEGGVVQ
jgi:MFS family permease